MSIVNITSADSTLILTVEDLYSSGFTVTNFAADTAFEAADSTIAETRMGVDGKLAAGYTPNPTELTLTVEADSDSAEKLQNVYEKSVTNKKAYVVKAQVTIPAISKEITLKNGVMTTARSFPSVKKTLDSVSYKFVFESVSSASI